MRLPEIEKERMQRERRMTRAILIICLTSLVSSSAMFVTYDLREIIKPGGQTLGIGTVEYTLLYLVVVCQFSINVFIYAAKCEPFRKAYLDILSALNPFPAISR